MVSYWFFLILHLLTPTRNVSFLSHLDPIFAISINARLKCLFDVYIIGESKFQPNIAKINNLILW